ncbi:MAG: ABC transporter substrate-binding protein [Chloroflexi bacterium]|nr:ABC transporter substrate-binding protein [Chloroflexota bacterium]
MRKPFYVVLVSLVVLSMLLAACGGAAPTTAVTQPTTPPSAGGAQPTTAPTAAPAAAEATATVKAAVPTAVPTATIAPPKSERATKIEFWHSMAGDIGGKAIPQMANDFNTSQDKCYVTPIYQGSYDDSLNKLKAGLQSNQTPAIVQVYDIGTRLLVDLGVATPVQNYIDKEKYDISDLEGNVLSYYTVDNKLYSMPFNTSTPILYYNKDMFKAAGLDPEKPPRTFDEFAADAAKLTQKDASGKTTVYGAAFAIYGWFFEQFLAVSGGMYVDNNNGRDGFATKATFNGPEGLNIFQWWQKMVNDGVMANYGRKTVDTRNAFLAGQTAMFIDSTAVLRGMMDSTKGKMDIGTAFLPRPTEDAYSKWGTIIGGGSLWIVNNRPTAEQDCAWEFIRFQSSPEEQAYWWTMSGYFPIRKSAYDTTVGKDWSAKYPQYTTAIDQLHQTPVNRVTQGALIGVFPSARATIETGIEEILSGKSTPHFPLDNAAQTVTQAIQDYNASMGLK